jgi:aryl-alcohol dehydrogenase-like predicted oxidoreductase
VSGTYDRREFLVGPVRWAAAAGLLSGVAPSLLAQVSTPRDGAKIITRTLGRTGISLPIVSMGVMNADVPGLIRRAYEVGIRHFDTAAFYQGGRNEEMVGAMIKEMGVRDQVTITTKALPFYKGGPAAEARNLFRQTVEASLKRLQMDHVDIVCFHAVDSAEIARAEGPIQALTELKKEGKTRFTGLSTHEGEAVLNEAVRLGVYDVALVPFNYTMASNTALLSAIERAAKAGMGIVAMKTQAGGGGRGRGPRPAGPPPNHTALLKWVLRHQFITPRFRATPTTIRFLRTSAWRAALPTLPLKPRTSPGSPPWRRWSSASTVDSAAAIARAAWTSRA